MKYAFEITKTNRNHLAKILEMHTLEQLNTIPDGFKNNIIWNIGHIVVVQQLLVYKLSGLPTMVSDEMIAKYQKGSKPEDFINQDEVTKIKFLLFETIDQTIRDVEKDVFKTYHSFSNSLGFSMNTAEEAITFNNFHEAIHMGIIMSLRKFI